MLEIPSRRNTPAANHETDTAMKLHHLILLGALPFAFAACNKEKAQEAEESAKEAVESAKDAAKALLRNAGIKVETAT